MNEYPGQQVSPDGQWRWDGQQWQAIAQHESPDGQWQWDGQQWQPRPERPQPLPHVPDHHPGYSKKRTAMIIAGLVVGSLILLSVAIALAPQPPATPVAAANPPAQATPRPTVHPAVKPTPVATPVPTPVATPVPTPRPAPAGPVILAQDQGSGSNTSTPFTAPNHWTIKYTYDCIDSSFGMSGNFQIFVYQGSNLVALPVNELGNSGATSSDVYGGGSNMHLEVNSECNWSYQVLNP
jgi:hypothetical protein